MARRTPGRCRCRELGEDCPACAAAISRAEDRDYDVDDLGGFDPDYHFPRNYGGPA